VAVAAAAFGRLKRPADVVSWRLPALPRSGGRGGINPKMAKQLQELQKESSRLKKLVADQALGMLILKEAARPNCLSRASPPDGFHRPAVLSEISDDRETERSYLNMKA
jgi:hypothetical protein